MESSWCLLEIFFSLTRPSGPGPSVIAMSVTNYLCLPIIFILRPLIGPEIIWSVSRPLIGQPSFSHCLGFLPGGWLVAYATTKSQRDFGCWWEGAILHYSKFFVVFKGFSLFFVCFKGSLLHYEQECTSVNLFNIFKLPQRWIVLPLDKFGNIHPNHDMDMCG